MLEEDVVEVEDVRQSLGVLLRPIEFKQMQQRQIGIQSSVVVDVDLAEGIVVYTCILEHFGMILTRNIVDYFFAIERGSQAGTVQNEEISDGAFVDDEEGFDFGPGVHHQLVSEWEREYPWRTSERERMKECRRP
jgi:hypothetical protein